MGRAKPETVAKWKKKKAQEGVCVYCYKRPAVEGPRGGKSACNTCRDGYMRRRDRQVKRAAGVDVGGWCARCLCGGGLHRKGCSKYVNKMTKKSWRKGNGE